jgi:hypothetical protein
MSRARPLARLGSCTFLLAVLAGCSSVDQLPDPNPASETLVVAYGDPGLSPDPCDDVLPQIDGVATDVEWESAKPLFVHMTGTDGSGGADYFLEIRAVWTDESRVGGTDRIYFMVRYPDNDQNITPDLLGYIHVAGGELCDHPAVVGSTRYCPSPTPGVLNVDVTNCDTVLVKNYNWTRLNEGGREDQVFFLLTQVASSEAPSTLIDLNRILLTRLGPELPENPADRDVGGAGTNDTDVWAWRAGRTNLHPVPQFAEWGTVTDDTPVPVPAFSKFTQNCGFCEDLWVSGGTINDDAGLTPFLRNFGKTFPESGLPRVSPATGDTLDTVPVYLTQCPPRGRDPSPEELANQNGGLPKDLALWRHSAKFMNECDSLACSRSGARPPKWSHVPLPQVPTTLEDFDFLPGWAIRVPYSQSSAPSGRDVRAKAAYGVAQDKGFGVWTLEVMRDLDTGQSDDLVIHPCKIDPNNPSKCPGNSGTSGEYRMVIGVLDASGKVGSGSTEIRLKFEDPYPKARTDPRC